MQQSKRNHISHTTKIPMTCPPERFARRSETKAGVKAEVGIRLISITFNRRRTNMRYLLVLIAAVLLSSAVDAQLRINLGFNVDRQPIWGPAGYDHAEYYYLPDIEAYYSVPQHMYYFQERGRWIQRSSLPSRYRDFDLYSAHKEVINERTPWRNHAMYRDKYASYKGQHDQQPIRDARDPKYYVNPHHPEHNNWVKQQQHDNGKGKAKGRDNNPGQNKKRDDQGEHR